jgi:hypothetical protein
MSSEGGTIGSSGSSAGSRAEPSSRAEPEASGWVLFAGVMILIAGTMNLIYGIAAIAESSFYVSNTRFVFSDLKTWGWIVTIIGAIECTAALGIWARQPWARWTGVTIATLNGVAQLLFIAAFPLLSLAVFTLDVLVIYGLIAHGGESEGA